ncbi:MAG: hypothetical protein M3250_06700, partial [Thermoproteota archaeon]|nr:hypothetical protein [Thermoproteota archaeon]
MVGRISILFLFAIIGLGWCLQVDNHIFPLYAQEEQRQYSYLTKWGANGISFGKFSQPLEIAIDSEGNVYVTDFTSVANKVQKFTKNGTFITSWGTLGFGNGRFSNPTGIDVDPSNNVYIADFGSPDTAIQKFTKNGTFITSWGSTGLGDGQF